MTSIWWLLVHPQHPFFGPWWGQYPCITASLQCAQKHNYHNNTNGPHFSAKSVACLPRRGHGGTKLWYLPVLVSSQWVWVGWLLFISRTALLWHLCVYGSLERIPIEKQIWCRRAVMTIRKIALTPPHFGEKPFSFNHSFPPFSLPQMNAANSSVANSCSQTVSILTCRLLQLYINERL